MSALTLTKIEEEIIADAREEAKRRVEAAEKEAAAALERAKAEAQKKVEEIKAATQEQIKVLERRKLSEARREAALKILKEKNTLIEKAFKEAFKRVKERKDKEAYEKSARRLLEEAVKSIEAGSLKLRISHNDRKLYSDIVTSLNKPAGVSLSVEKEELPSVGGFVLSTADEQIKIDNTIEARFDMVSRAMKKNIAAILFE